MTYRTTVCLMTLALAAASCRNTQGPTQRPLTWARPIEQSGLPNFHQVSPGLYRAAQPTAEGLAAFKNMGGKTIVNLRKTDDDRALIDSLGLNYAWRPVDAFGVNKDDVQWFLRYASDPANQPLLIHCRHGADRTGVMIAAWRVVVERWTKDDAIKEMTTGGYHFHPLWQNLVGLIHRMDVQAMRQAIATR